MKELIDETRTRLAQATTLKYIDEDWGQIDYVVAQPVKWPCALISIYSGTFTELGIDRTKTPQNRQMGEYIVEIRFANLKMAPSSSRAKPSMKQNSLSIHDVLAEAHALLQGWSPGGQIGKYIRDRFKQEVRDDGIQEYKVQYTVGVSNT